MRFRPCIDLHEGRVKQIVGATLTEGGAATNFVSTLPPRHYADLYHRDGFRGGHVIMLGKGNEDAAHEALGVHPGNLQVGGGIRPDNARQWLEAGASHVIVTSYLFVDGELDWGRASEMTAAVGREHLVIDLSCVPVEGQYHVACNRWQTVCKTVLDRATMEHLAEFCGEFLVHAVQVEGRQAGIDEALVSLLADLSPIPVTYAGGIRGLEDIHTIGRAGGGRIDFTVGSALDIFGGTFVQYQDMLQWR